MDPTIAVSTCDPRALDGTTNPLRPEDMVYIYKHHPNIDAMTDYSKPDDP